MSSDAVDTEPRTMFDAVALRDKLTLQVQGLIDDAGTTSKPDERRVRDRFPIPYTFRLIPISDNGTLLTDETTTVVGKDISLSGVAFSHDHELRYRRAIISLDHRMVGPLCRRSGDRLDPPHADRPLRKRLPPPPHPRRPHRSRQGLAASRCREPSGTPNRTASARRSYLPGIV